MNIVTSYILNKLIKRGCLRIIDAQGHAKDFGLKNAAPKVTIKITDNSFFSKFLLQPSMTLGEFYMQKKLLIENGSIYELLELLDMNRHNLSTKFSRNLRTALLPITRRIQQYNTIRNSRKNVEHHYDLSSEFYRLWLDSDMQYSCAYFKPGNEDLEQAQLDKKEHIAKKLLLKPGQKILDIGCGWGGMALYLAKNFDVEVTGLTLSLEQLRIARERAKIAGLQDKVHFILRDYREEKNHYDRIVSVGMFEHVGVNHYPEFFAAINRLLKDDGVMLLHSIGRADGPGTTDAWIRKYIFPGGYVPALSEVMKIIEQNSLWTTDIEVLRLHYAKTLNHWRHRFLAKLNQVQYDEEFRRMWEFYLAASELEFIYDRTMVMQIQLAKKVDAVPVTREYMLS